MIRAKTITNSFLAFFKKETLDCQDVIVDSIVDTGKKLCYEIHYK